MSAAPICPATPFRPDDDAYLAPQKTAIILCQVPPNLSSSICHRRFGGGTKASKYKWGKVKEPASLFWHFPTSRHCAPLPPPHPSHYLTPSVAGSSPLGHCQGVREVGAAYPKILTPRDETNKHLSTVRPSKTSPGKWTK